MYKKTHKNKMSIMLNQCLSMLKRDDIKKEVKQVLSPLFDVLFYQYAPYLYFLYFLFLVNIGVSFMILYKLKYT